MPDKQDILLEQYKILHEATQAAHKYAWQMTSIFVPVVGAGLVFALGQPSPGIRGREVLLATLIVIVWFWKGVLAFLEHSNSIRRRRLVALEQELSDAHQVLFSYYGEFKPERAIYRNFSKLTTILAILLIAALLIVMMWLVP